MAAAKLMFLRDKGTGLPRLEAEGIPLTPSQRRGLEAEINGLFEWLVERGDGNTVVFDTKIGKLDAPLFRVSKRGRGRCPDLTFEPVNDPGEVPTSSHDNARRRANVFRELGMPNPVATSHATSSSTWESLFLHAVHLAVHQHCGRLPKADRVAFEYVLDELRNLFEDRGRDNTLVLLAGYFALGQEMCRQYDPDRLGLYRLAGRALDSIYANNAGRKSPAHSAEGNQLETLKRSSSTVCRVLGTMLGVTEPDPVPHDSA